MRVNIRGQRRQTWLFHLYWQISLVLGTGLSCAALCFAVRDLCVHLPGITLAALVLVWGAYAIADGVMALIAAFTMHEEGKPLASLIMVGILGIAAGIVTFLWSGMTALVFLLFIASWAVLMGIFQIAAAIRLRKHIENE